MGTGDDDPGRRLEAGRNDRRAGDLGDAEDVDVPGTLLVRGQRQAVMAEAAVLDLMDHRPQGVGIARSDGGLAGPRDDQRVRALRAPTPSQEYAAVANSLGAEVRGVGKAGVRHGVADRQHAR